MQQLLPRIVIVLIPFVLLAWLTVYDVAPGGVQTVRYEVGSLSPYVNSLLPSDRVVTDGDVATIVDEPVYFSVVPPGDDFETVTVGLEFDPHEQPIVELGGLTDVRSYAFDFRSMSNQVLENLDWHRLENGPWTLFSRTKIKATLADFLAFPPERSEIATYRATFPTPYRKTDYTPLGGTQRFDVSLRGSHEYVTYLKNETFLLDVMYTDVNRTYGADEGAIRVWNEAGEVVAEEVIADDGNISENQTFSSRTTLSLRVPDLHEGVYRVELSGTSDIFWRTLTTGQRYMTFKNKLYIGDDVGYLASPRSTSFVTNGERVVLETYHADSPQSVTFDGKAVGIPSSHHKVIHDIEADGAVVGNVPSGDIKMITEGKFALSAAAFFEPDPVPLTAFTHLDEVSYVYAATPEPQATFTLSSLQQENNAYKFAISAPSLKELGTTVDVYGVWLTFEKSPLTLQEALREAASRWYRAFVDKL